ncbi:esterase/lipase family protein [Roseibium sp.]|uniref:esterase/lipase family protein n=1 Tax=Roseibium sp. TaxID=1936156 RepID=UPI003A98469C
MEQEQAAKVTQQSAAEPDYRRRLVVLLHGYSNGKQALQGAQRVIKTAYPGATIYDPDLPYRNIFCRVGAARIVADQIAEISRRFEDGKFEDVVIIGHSMGAVIGRRIFIEASGLERHWPGPSEGKKAARVEPELAGITACPWASKVKRLVLIAGMSRGWSIDNAKSGTEELIWRLGATYGHLMPGRKPTIFDIRRGAPFIVQTRLRWLQFLDSGLPKPKVLQLLGTIDDMVSPDDSVDYADANSAEHFRLVEVPASGHATIVEMDASAAGNDAEKEIREERARIFRAVLTDDAEVLGERTIERGYLNDELPPPRDSRVRDLLYIIHGIRDRGYWTKKIAARVKRKAAEVAAGVYEVLASRVGETDGEAAVREHDEALRHALEACESAAEGRSLVTRTPSYGYFPILPFVLPWYRRQKVEWLMDQYVEARTSYPQAEFHYIGHSNGTYLCARALQDYPAASFKRIMFAGSVVRNDYDWEQLVNAGRVEKILNLRATFDWVVAIFPNGLRWFRGFFDLGGAGHSGFETSLDGSILYQLDEKGVSKFVRGAHSAGKRESLWDEICDFIVSGKQPLASDGDFAVGQPWYSRLAGWIAPVFLLLVGALVFGLGGLLLYTLGADFMNWLQGPVGDGSGSLWQAWMAQGGLIHALALLAFVVVLRFMSLRF